MSGEVRGPKPSHGSGVLLFSGEEAEVIRSLCCCSEAVRAVGLFGSNIDTDSASMAPFSSPHIKHTSRRTAGFLLLHRGEVGLVLDGRQQLRWAVSEVPLTQEQFPCSSARVSRNPVSAPAVCPGGVGPGSAVGGACSGRQRDCRLESHTAPRESSSLLSFQTVAPELHHEFIA